jgi:flagellar basal body-associated protein FliL
MADEQETHEEDPKKAKKNNKGEEGGEGKKKKGRKKKILILLVVGVGGYMMFGRSSGALVDAGLDPIPLSEEVGGAVVEVGTLTVNLADEAPRYVKVGVALVLVEELSLISRELETDGAVAEELAGGAIGLVSKRRSELESCGPPLTYAPAETPGASKGKITGSALRAGALTS